MGELRIYETDSHPLIVVDGKPLVPGALVIHSQDEEAFGIVTSLDATNISVLWSTVPKLALWFDPNVFTMRKGILPRYEKSKIRKDFYGTINVLDIPEEKKK